MTEQYKDTVFFSRLFKTDYPDLYRQIEEIIKESNIPHGFLDNTKDYWCRDYMPIQFGYNQFAQFVYRPDYLTGKDVYITDTDKVLKNLKIDIDVINKCQLVLDGGNYVCCECYEDKTCSTSVFIIMTEKEALEQFKLLFPQYGNKIYQIQMIDFISKWEGGLNCCSWSISKEMSACVHNEVNDSIFRSAAYLIKR